MHSWQFVRVSTYLYKFIKINISLCDITKLQLFISLLTNLSCVFCSHFCFIELLLNLKLMCYCLLKLFIICYVVGKELQNFNYIRKTVFTLPSYSICKWYK